jgi:hypothetical protein
VLCIGFDALCKSIDDFHRALKIRVVIKWSHDGIMACKVVSLVEGEWLCRDIREVKERPKRSGKDLPRDKFKVSHISRSCRHIKWVGTINSVVNGKKWGFGELVHEVKHASLNHASHKRRSHCHELLGSTLENLLC